MTYSENEDIEATMGFTIDSDSMPTETMVDNMREKAYGIINAEAKAANGMTDTYGELKAIECDLVYKMCMNVYAIKNPQDYGPVDIKLSPEQVRQIHMIHRRWSGLTFEVGG